jgi:putative endonuclease
MLRKDLQRYGEDAAAGHLQSMGMRILARNWQIRMGELDLVALDGDCLVFVEVKARASDAFADPVEGVDHSKRRRLRRLAQAYLNIHAPDVRDCRFDVISVVPGPRGPRLEHLPDAF